MNETKLPKVSVIIAVYNNKEYLPAAIKSALTQDYPNLDIYIVDDASPENVMPELPISTTGGIILNNITERVDEIESYQDRYSVSKPIIYIRLKKNSGPSVARNIAIANAMRNGSHLFQILDSDDQMYPTKVSELIKPILLDPERLACTYADYNIVNEQGMVHYESKPAFDFIRLMNGNCDIHSGSLINGLAIKDFYPYFYPEDQRVAEDLALWIKIFRQQHWLAYHVAKPLTYVRSHSNDSTNSVSKEIWQKDFQKAMSYR
jgi:glycosyltransferase involved in cell wall biosynthesis